MSYRANESNGVPIGTTTRVTGGFSPRKKDVVGNCVPKGTRHLMLLGLLFCILLCLLAAACKKEVKSEDVVRGVAEQYCSYLIDGDYGSYVDATYRTETLGADERTELIDNLKMFAAQQQKERQGITKAEVSKVEMSADDDAADVFLLVTYGDSTQEQVLQPMVKRGGLWYLR